MRPKFIFKIETSSTEHLGDTKIPVPHSMNSAEIKWMLKGLKISDNSGGAPAFSISDKRTGDSIIDETIPWDECELSLCSRGCDFATIIIERTDDSRRWTDFKIKGHIDENEYYWADLDDTLDNLEEESSKDFEKIFLKILEEKNKLDIKKSYDPDNRYEGAVQELFNIAKGIIADNGDIEDPMERAIAFFAKAFYKSDEEKKELDDIKKKLDNKEKELNGTKEKLDNNKKEFDDIKKKLERELNDTKENLNNKEKELDNIKGKLDKNQKNLKNCRRKLNVYCILSGVLAVILAVWTINHYNGYEPKAPDAEIAQLKELVGQREREILVKDERIDSLQIELNSQQYENEIFMTASTRQRE